MLSPDEEFLAAFAVALELESLFVLKVEPLILYIILTISGFIPLYRFGYDFTMDNRARVLAETSDF
jgi:hypothetical protein